MPLESLEPYCWLIPTYSEISAVVDIGGTGAYGSEIVGIGATYQQALTDAATNYEYDGIPTDPINYDVIDYFDKNECTGVDEDLYLYYFEPIYLFTAIRYGIHIEETLGKNEEKPDITNRINYCQKIYEIVKELNVKNGFDKYHPYYNYFSMYAENPDDEELRAEFDGITENFVRNYPNKRFSIYCGRFTGQTAEEAIKNMLDRYNMRDTALIDLKPEQIPKGAYVTDDNDGTADADGKVHFRIPCEVLDAAKSGRSLTDLIVYWDEFSDCENYIKLLDEADNLCRG